MRLLSLRFHVPRMWPLATALVLSATGCGSPSAPPPSQEIDVVEVADALDSDTRDVADSASSDGAPRSADSALSDGAPRSADWPADTMSFGEDESDGDADSCADGWFHYVDKSCFASTPGVPDIPCTEKGDGKCYLKCASDDDCGGVGMPCITLSLFNDGSSPCNKKAKVCGPQTMHKNCL